ncbi:424_t:CDS:2, partial [Entrophospora sp. SA101]
NTASSSNISRISKKKEKIYSFTNVYFERAFDPTTDEVHDINEVEIVDERKKSNNEIIISSTKEKHKSQSHARIKQKYWLDAMLSESNKFVKLLNNRLSKIEDLIANLNQTINNNNNNKSSLTENSNEISNLSLEQLQTLVSMNQKISKF